jgi:hypothetical protein
LLKSLREKIVFDICCLLRMLTFLGIALAGIRSTSVRTDHLTTE